VSSEPSQQRIWSHLQRQESEAIFRASHPRHAYLLKTIRRLGASPGAAVLNIGIGDGNFERRAMEAGLASCSLDPDTAAIERIRAAGVEARVGSIVEIPFTGDTFDFVVASEVLEHLTPEQRQLGLEEIRRVLKPGGYLLGTVPYQEDLGLNVAVCPQCSQVFHRWGHTTAFDIPALRDEVARYFTVTACRRTVFVEFRGRSPLGMLKSAARWILARLGAAIAVPSIFFVARKEHRDQERR